MRASRDFKSLFSPDLLERQQNSYKIVFVGFWREKVTEITWILVLVQTVYSPSPSFPQQGVWWVWRTGNEFVL